MADEVQVDSNTVADQPKKANPIPNSKPFKKGDPRINRKGRPKSFDQWRALTVEVLREPAKDKNGAPIIIDGHVATNAEMIARDWMRNSKRQKDLIEAAFGKVPDEVNVSVNWKEQAKANGIDPDKAKAAALAAVRAAVDGSDDGGGDGGDRGGTGGEGGTGQGRQLA